MFDASSLTQDLVGHRVRDLKVCDDGILIPLLVFWTLSIVQFLFKNNVSEIETSSVQWAQLSRLLPEDGDRVQSPKRCF
jgi:hypothetical protein